MHAPHKLIKCQIVSLTHLKIYFEHVAHIKTNQPVRHLLSLMGGSVVDGKSHSDPVCPGSGPFHVQPSPVQAHIENVLKAAARGRALPWLTRSVNVNNKTQIKCIQRTPGSNNKSRNNSTASS